MILGGEVRAEHEQARQMQLASLDRAEQRWEPLHQPGRADPAKGCIFRQPQFVNAISVETGAGAKAVQPARFDLRQVNEQRGEDLIYAPHETACVREQIVIGQVAEAVLLSNVIFDEPRREVRL
jgi:hypothetical protein